jgi:3-deoxy-manno-octulosonate cytidylyltransferase (CMP-KDO synthetase)
MKSIIVIPARLHSKRLPEKPLLEIKGVTLLKRVLSIAFQVKKKVNNLEIIVATDDDKIFKYCLSLGVKCVMTDININSGSERAYEACRSLSLKSDLIVNLQGDAPFITVDQILSVLQCAKETKADVVTPVFQLTWEMLDELRESKKITPFSGTTCVLDEKGIALWFSKNILPSIRNEQILRNKSMKSPVFQHIGLYCYKFDVLKWFINSSQGNYEKLEELEQLRFIENGHAIQTVAVECSPFAMSGIDSPEDIILAEKKIDQLGDPFIKW